MTEVQDSGESILLEAQRLTHGDRNKDYGHPLDDYTKNAGIINALFAHKLREPFTAADVALIMVGVKLSRQVNRPKRDNMVDAAGYAWVAHACIEETERRTEMAVLAAMAKIKMAQIDVRQAKAMADAQQTKAMADTTEKADLPAGADGLARALHRYDELSRSNDREPQSDYQTPVSEAYPVYREPVPTQPGPQLKTPSRR